MLSMEERMAVYKRKYSAPNAVAESRAEAPRKERSTGTQSEVSKVRKRRNNRRHDNKVKENRAAGVSEAAIKQDAPSQEAEAKKGILSKIMGFFGKK